MKRLLVLVPDYVSVILQKGEYQSNYYNPGEVFDEIHLLLMNDDRPDVIELKHTVGRAIPIVHNFAPPSFEHTLGYRPWLMRRWAQDAVQIACGIKPHLARCYGHSPITFVASEIKRSLGVPYVVSLHGNPDVDYFRGRLAKTFRQRIEGTLSRRIETVGLQNADLVLPVYSPICSYLDSIGVSRYRLIYNAVGHGSRPKSDYRIDKSRLKAICVGRQVPEEKDPRPILQALAEVPEAHLTLIGDGPLHDGLVQLARSLGVEARVTFIPRLENAEVLRLVGESDLFVYQSDNFEISKGTMEAALAGLPIIVNERAGGLADEIRNGPFLVVEGNARGYVHGFRKIIDNDALRESLGRKAAEYGRSRWDAAAMEDAVATIYRELMLKGH